MRKIVVVLLMLCTCSLFAEIRWTSKVELEKINEKRSNSGQHEYAALIYCDTWAEVEEVVKKDQYLFHFDGYKTIDDIKKPYFEIEYLDHYTDEAYVNYYHNCVIEKYSITY